MYITVPQKVIRSSVSLEKYSTGKPSKNKDKKQKVNTMVHNAFNEIHQGKPDKNISAKADKNGIHEDENFEGV